MSRQQRRAEARAQAKAVSKAERTGDASDLTAAAHAQLDGQRWAEAERLARAALDREKDHAMARVVLRTSLWRQGRLDEAMLEARRVLRLQPDDPLAHEALAFVLHEQDRLPESVAAFERALALCPDRWFSHLGLGNSLSSLGALEQARMHHERAVELAPDEMGPRNDLARTHFLMGDYDAAVRESGRAMARAQGRLPMVEWNRALALLGQGDLEPGWAAYEAGLVSGARKPHRTPDVPRWQGESLTDKTLLVWGEQGLGDEVRFASCFPDVVARAGHVVIEANPRLVPLFARAFPDATVREETFDRSTGRETSSFEGIEFHSPAGSLPRHLRPSLDSFPPHAAYLSADATQRAHHRERLASLPPGIRVGICWRSMNLATHRLSHYTTLDEWEPVLQLSEVTFVNLQYGDAALREKELAAAEERFSCEVHRWDDVDYTGDLEAVAGLTAELDVVVGPNTFSTILAGALGVPTLVIGLPAIWQHGQEREPWAPSALHLTRRWDESWGPVMERAAEELQRRASA